MSEPYSHLDLLRIARSIRAAAVDDDTDLMHAELRRLRSALIEHTTTEQRQLDGVAPAAHIARSGQERLLGLLNELLFTTTDQPDACNCIVRAAEVEVSLRRQAKLEAAAQHASRTLRFTGDDHR